MFFPSPGADYPLSISPLQAEELANPPAAAPTFNPLVDITLVVGGGTGGWVCGSCLTPRPRTTQVASNGNMAAMGNKGQRDRRAALEAGERAAREGNQGGG